MHLLNVHTYQLKRFTDERSAPPYAILSHTWADGKEVQYTDILKHSFDARDDSLNWKKIDLTCQQAIADGFEFAWIDTCCIDKSSSAELSEAINSMFQWYRKSKICYAYMADVGDAPVVDDSGEGIEASPNFIADPETNSSQLSLPTSSRRLLRTSQLRESRWFTRGWTLQELIAPSTIVFYDCNWRLLGDRTQLLPDITAVTGIPDDVLIGSKPLKSVGIAVRMSWASRRETTRLEDEAYCLLGIFDINMPLLYGEGSKAFMRLQEEIVKVSTDHTIFAWNGTERQLLAPSPVNFVNSGTIVPRDLPAPGESHEMTSSGCRISLPLVRSAEIDFPRMDLKFDAVLDCVDLHRPDTDVCLPLFVCDELSSTFVAEPRPHILTYNPPSRRYDRYRNPRKRHLRRQQLVIGRWGQNQDKEASLTIKFALAGIHHNMAYRLFPEGHWDEDTCVSTVITRSYDARTPMNRSMAVWVGKKTDCEPHSLGRRFLQWLVPPGGVLVAWKLAGEVSDGGIFIYGHHTRRYHRAASQTATRLLRALDDDGQSFPHALLSNDHVLNYHWAQFHVSFRLEPVGMHQNGMTVVFHCGDKSDAEKRSDTLERVFLLAMSPFLLIIWLCDLVGDVFRRRGYDLGRIFG
ncbi:hypothetical protein PRZ48_012490 [Zasmidium cellare]|uniref:Heterokaryon incompatibility domain-containing protein n=1 Tax=Zasmidium cellare TaxID=395010 RepID=A0ABR0E5L0_ZASCE|nr:hypothetical protein PRZ48_012490 [Zasmidium cellare]